MFIKLIEGIMRLLVLVLVIICQSPVLAFNGGFSLETSIHGVKLGKNTSDGRMIFTLRKDGTAAIEFHFNSVLFDEFSTARSMYIGGISSHRPCFRGQKKGVYIDDKKVMNSDSECLRFFTQDAVSINNLGPQNYTNFEIDVINHINIMENGEVKKVTFCRPEEYSDHQHFHDTGLSLEHLQRLAIAHASSKRTRKCASYL